jgi:exopolysaccharide production protein ExoQ
MESRPEHKIFWPIMAAISVILVVRNRALLGRLAWPPHIFCLLAYLAFAGASVSWAFSPDLSFIRFAQQVMIVTSIILPAMLATRTTDMMRGLFLCFAFASILNVFFVFGRPPLDFKYATWGYTGYFSGKNYLGEFAAVALLLSLHEVLYRGRRRVMGIIAAFIAAPLLFLSNSKTALALALLTPFMAGLTLITRKRLVRISPAIVPIVIIGSYLAVSTIIGFSINRVSYAIYSDSTFTGRTIIWDFAQKKIDLMPLLGWGYQSFWLVGPGGPSTTAPGWVKGMPNAHNGYLDTTLEMGYVGLALLTVFILVTLHGIGRVADREPRRAWLLLSLAFYIMITNGLESVWMRGFEMLWVVFLILAAEIGRYWQPIHRGGRSLHKHRYSFGPRRHGARPVFGDRMMRPDRPPENAALDKTLRV